MRDFNLAQDILQDCLLKAYLNLSGLIDENKVLSWLYKIAVNSAKDYFKKNTTEYYADLEYISEANLYTQTEMKYDISQYLMRLEPCEREIIILKDMLDYSYDEISELLDISQSNVGVRLYRARDKFKELIYNTEYSSREGKF
jgi:RNA polymerase sigma-70 factor (ECF subfamily)